MENKLRALSYKEIYRVKLGNGKPLAIMAGSNKIVCIYNNRVNEIAGYGSDDFVYASSKNGCNSYDVGESGFDCIELCVKSKTEYLKYDDYFIITNDDEIAFLTLMNGAKRLYVVNKNILLLSAKYSTGYESQLMFVMLPYKKEIYLVDTGKFKDRVVYHPYTYTSRDDAKVIFKQNGKELYLRYKNPKKSAFSYTQFKMNIKIKLKSADDINNIIKQLVRGKELELDFEDYYKKHFSK